jgi:DNA polymerase-3 subunit alpha
VQALAQPGRALFFPTDAALAPWTVQAHEQRAETVFD